MTAVGLIYIKHPDIDRLGGPVTEESLELIHSRKRWRAATAKEVEDFERDESLGVEPNRPPAKTAPKAEWVDWAVAQGADRPTAEAATKEQLVSDYGQEG